MDAANSVTSQNTVQALSQPTATASTPSQTEVRGNFAAMLQSLITPDKANQLSEEELFAGSIHDGIEKLKGSDLAQTYDTALLKDSQSIKQSDGFICWEDAGKLALKDLRTSGTLSGAEADKVYSQAFAAAQLDSNLNDIWDGRGRTVAVADTQTALKKAEDMFTQIDTGTVTVSARSLDEITPNGPTLGGATVAIGKSAGSTGSAGSGPFLWKPVSQNEGKAIVILPDAFAHKVQSVFLKDATENIIDQAQSVSYGDTGTREKLKFSKAGQDYTGPLTVQVTLNDQTVFDYFIPSPKKRSEIQG